MAEQQPEGLINGGGVVVTAAGGTSSENPGPSLGSKRQRRPSVRLGDIGDQSATLAYELYINRRSKQWNDPKYRQQQQSQHSQKETALSGKSSKTRPLLNLGNGSGSTGGGGDFNETLESEDKNPSVDELGVIVGNNRKGKDLKTKKGGGGMKRVRSNWVSKVDEGGEDGDNEKFSGGDDENEWYEGFDVRDSESPLREQSPILRLDNTTTNNQVVSDKGHGKEREGIFLGGKRSVRGVRVQESRDHGAVELDGPLDTDGREWKGGTNSDKNGVRERERGRCSRSLEDGVQTWLNGLGLERYAPVFEIHEVDEDVLPLLTLDDLRDMGINAVGSRRKLYSAIQKLAKGFC